MNKKEIQEWCEGKGYEPEFNGEGIDVIIFGEEHARTNEKFRKPQKELTAIVKPEFLLHERASVKTYDSKTRHYGIAPESRANFSKEFDPYSSIIKWADEQGLYVAGIDISLAELKRKKFRNEDYYESEIINQHREKRMGKRIIEYNAKRTTIKPNVSIVGQYHILARSAIHPVLQKAKLGYITIDQTR